MGIKPTEQDLEANWIYNKIQKNTSFSERGINIIDNNFNAIAGFEYRDAFNEMKETLCDTLHATCLVGLRRTGKSIMLMQAKKYLIDSGIKEEEILHVSLSARHENMMLNRDNVDIAKISNKNIIYPKLNDLAELIEVENIDNKLKFVFIDEVTLCEEFILNSKGLLDKLMLQGIKILLAGTESASFIIANNEALFARLKIIDISFISFGEYCRLKKLNVNTYDEKRKALDKYVKHGNILDDTVEIDDKYIESSVGINLALSIINSDNTLFSSNLKDIAQNIIKYLKLLGETISLDRINDAISRSNISKAIKNINKRKNEKITLSKSKRSTLAVNSANKYFKQYKLSLDRSEIEMTSEQLNEVDEIFNNMGMLYSLTRMPLLKIDGALESDDIYTIHGILFTIGESLVNYIKNSTDLGLSEEEIEELSNNIEETLYGNIIENIIVMHYIKEIEKKHKLNSQLTYYDKFKAKRKSTRPYLYKYRELIGEGDTAEIDIVVHGKNKLSLIEVKRSSEIVDNQTRWLRNEEVCNRIREIIADKELEKFVYYLGEPKNVDGIRYVNVADALLSLYEQSRK